MSKRIIIEFLTLILVSSTLIVCASIPKYVPPELPKRDVCEDVGIQVLNKLDDANEAVKGSLPGKVVHFESRIVGQTCLSKDMGLFSVMLDIVVKVEGNEMYICSSHFFLIEAKVVDKELESRILRAYPGEEEICDFKETK